MPPKYKLTYFNLRGRGELIRLLFVAAGVEFEDVRISFEEWKAFKAKTPLGALPILEFDGITLAESRAIARYVAKETNQYGKDHIEQARVDMITDFADGLASGMMKVIMQKNESDKEAMMKKFMNEDSAKILTQLDKMLVANKDGDGYFVGDTLTMADLHLFAISDALLKLNPAFLKDFPKLEAHRKRIDGLPRIAAWLPSRPEKISAFD